ncbi:MAG: hypothetical protein V8Q82_05670 [Christensenellales bacterium]
MKKWICLGLVCVLLSLLACAGMAESPTEVEDAGNVQLPGAGRDLCTHGR